MLDVRRLRVFSAVAEHGSFSAAAEALFMRCAAVTQQLALLERRLGLTLVVRRPRGVELTEPGRVLAERCLALFGGIGDVEREMRDLVARDACVRLAVFPTAGADLVPKVVRDYQERFPGVRVELRSVHAGEITDCLRRGTRTSASWRISAVRLRDAPLATAITRSIITAGLQAIESSKEDELAGRTSGLAGGQVWGSGVVADGVAGAVPGGRRRDARVRDRGGDERRRGARASVAAPRPIVYRALQRLRGLELVTAVGVEPKSQAPRVRSSRRPRRAVRPRAGG